MVGHIVQLVEYLPSMHDVPRFITYIPPHACTHTVLHVHVQGTVHRTSLHMFIAALE